MFAIPIALGSELAELDLISMADLVEQQRTTSRHLRWYINDACRDDEQDRVLTWPEGNGWIVKQLIASAMRERSTR